jgi:hypothetical protein
MIIKVLGRFPSDKASLNLLRLALPTILTETLRSAK